MLSKRSSHIPFHISFLGSQIFVFLAFVPFFFFSFPIYFFPAVWCKIVFSFSVSFLCCVLFKCDISPATLSCRPQLPALSQAAFSAITLSYPPCLEHCPLPLYVTNTQRSPHLLQHFSPHFFSRAHLRIKQMQDTSTEYSSSHSHKPVKAHRPRSYLCINLNLL